MSKAFFAFSRARQLALAVQFGLSFLFVFKDVVVVMFRRSRPRLGYEPLDPDMDPSHYYGVFGWHYLLPQVMNAPQNVNRRVPMPQRRYAGIRAFPSVWIETEMHPAFRVALDPYLRKLPLTRFATNVSVGEAINDYSSNASKVGDITSRHGWLAKVVHHAALKKAAKDVLPLWAGECHDMYVKGDQTPPVPLAMAMVYCTAVSDTPEWSSFFICCQKSKWNLTPRFSNALWDVLLTAAGRRNDEVMSMRILEEAVDLQVDLNTLRARSLVRALNAIRDKELYERVKKLLFLLSPDKVKILSRIYVRLRSEKELHPAKAEEEPFEDNDAMFYHVLWHNRIRSPLRFQPRQLYFDYSPSDAIEEKTFTKKSADDIVAERVAKWKREGLVPEDYVYQSKYVNKSETFGFFARQEKWKKKPTFFEKGPGWTPQD